MTTGCHQPSESAHGPHLAVAPLVLTRTLLTVLSLGLSACACRQLSGPVPTLPVATPQSERVLGDTFARSSDGMALVYVPAGEFQMGSDREGICYARKLCQQYGGKGAIATCGTAAFANEQPAHTVELSAFWIDRTEVTNGQYRRCVEAGACSPPDQTGSYTREAYFGEPGFDDYPVIWVTWQQATDYCSWAGSRLPTEAEWEYAARGPQSWIFPWGNDLNLSRLNYCDASCATGVTDQLFDDGYPETAPVGSFPTGVSWCGALDMAGNVREWIGDWFAYYGKDRQVNPSGPASGQSRIPKGGCWLDTPDDTRCANRGENAPDYARHKVSFRCAVDDRPALQLP